MILFDTETTGLVGAEALPLEKQPHIIEFCAIKLNDYSLEEEAVTDFLVNPGIPISSEITKITGIKQSDVDDKHSFGHYWQELVDFFIGQRILVAHNCDFDSKLLSFELKRIGKQYLFPWPPHRICTVEASIHLRGHRLSLGQLHEIAFGQAHVKAHRAINDVRAMANCLRWLHTNNKIKLPCEPTKSPTPRKSQLLTTPSSVSEKNSVKSSMQKIPVTPSSKSESAKGKAVTSSRSKNNRASPRGQAPLQKVKKK